MRIGVVFPQTEIGADPEGIRVFAREVERMGFRHLLAYDHVLGADPRAHAPWTGVYTVDDQFHEPLILFAHLAAACSSLEFVTGVLVGPQRQTALVAKQAAEVDLLSDGRLRLGLGIGWNKVEYDALGQDFHQRGKRLDEQIGLLRRLWAEPAVTHTGVTDRIIGAGVSPRPRRGSIPVWLGARSARAYARVGQVADGWFPLAQPGTELDAARRAVADAALAAGRDPGAIGMEGRLNVSADGDRIADAAAQWAAAGASHLSVNTMRHGLTGTAEHLSCLAAVARDLALS